MGSRQPIRETAHGLKPWASEVGWEPGIERRFRSHQPRGEGKLSPRALDSIPCTKGERNIS